MRQKPYRLAVRRVKLALLACIFLIQAAGAVLYAAPSAESSLPAVLAEAERPGVISRAQAEEKGHLKRLYERESDLSTIVFQDAGGQETMYLFGAPVKFYDEAGVLRDKSNKLYAIESASARGGLYAYTNSDNDIRAYFPADLTETGVLLTGANLDLTMTPVISAAQDTRGIAARRTAETTSASGDRTEYVWYDGVFGEGTALRYTPLLEGFKEDIVLYENTGGTFAFLLDTGGLYLEAEFDAVKLMDPETHMPRGVIAPVDMTDSAGNSARSGYMTFAQLDSGLWSLTVHADKAFLADEKTVYPVYVDPTVTISTSGSGAAKTIVDTPLYSGFATTNHGANVYNKVGYAGTSGALNYKIGRTLIAFPGLSNNATYASLPAYKINHAYFYMYEGSGTASASAVDVYRTASAWTESGATYNANGSYGDWVSAKTVQQTGFYIAFDIYDLVIGDWKTGSAAHTPARGVMLVNSNESSTSKCKTFLSTEYASNKPYIEIQYVNLSYYGAREFTINSQADSGRNCLMYAFDLRNTVGEDMTFSTFMSLSEQNELKSTTSSVARCLEITRNAMEKTGGYMDAYIGVDNWRLAASPYSAVNAGEWLVAMRVAYDPAASETYDYHFWYRTDTGQWSHKLGFNGDPEMLAEQPPYDDSYGWYNIEIEIGGSTVYYNNNPYYTSDIVYYIVAESLTHWNYYK